MSEVSEVIDAVLVAKQLWMASRMRFYTPEYVEVPQEFNIQLEQAAQVCDLFNELELQAKRLCLNERQTVNSPRDVVADGQPGEWIRAVFALDTALVTALAKQTEKPV